MASKGQCPPKQGAARRFRLACGNGRNHQKRRGGTQSVQRFQNRHDGKDGTLAPHRRRVDFTQCRHQASLVGERPFRIFLRTPSVLHLAFSAHTAKNENKGPDSGFRFNKTRHRHASRALVFLADKSADFRLSGPCCRKNTDISGRRRVLCRPK